MYTKTSKHTEDLIKTIFRIKEISKEQFENIRTILEGKPSSIIPLLLNQTSSAKYLGLSRQTMWKMKKDGLINPVVLPNGMIMYKREDLEKLAGMEEK